MQSTISRVYHRDVKPLQLSQRNNKIDSFLCTKGRPVHHHQTGPGCEELGDKGSSVKILSAVLTGDTEASSAVLLCLFQSFAINLKARVGDVFQKHFLLYLLKFYVHFDRNEQISKKSTMCVGGRPVISPFSQNKVIGRIICLSTYLPAYMCVLSLFTHCA